jgi:uncharacterized protein
LLLLVSKTDRKVRIEVGKGYGRRLDSSMTQIIDTRITRRFRAGQFAKGIVSAVDGIIELVTPRSAPPVQLPAEAPEGSPLQKPKTDSLPQLQIEALETPNEPERQLAVAASPPWGFLLTLLGVLGSGFVAIIWLMMRLFKGGKPRCESCAREMALLTEQEEDPFLQSGQKLEEAMGSVDYRVWKCSSCAQTRISPHKRWLSGVEQCPGCKLHTIKRNTRMKLGHLQQRQQLIVRDCDHCGFHDERTVTLPQTHTTDHLTASGMAGSNGFSDSGSSFGSSSSSDSGGSSSGGGASGSW